MPPRLPQTLSRPPLPRPPLPSALAGALPAVLPPALLAALATFVRARLADMSGTVSLVVVGAAGPFAPTSYSRARLVRQMYASGLLTGNAADAVIPAAIAGDAVAGDAPVPAVEHDAAVAARYAYTLHPPAGGAPERSAR